MHQRRPVKGGTVCWRDEENEMAVMSGKTAGQLVIERKAGTRMGDVVRLRTRCVPPARALHGEPTTSLSLMDKWGRGEASGLAFERELSVVNNSDTQPGFGGCVVDVRWEWDGMWTV